MCACRCLYPHICFSLCAYYTIQVCVCARQVCVYVCSCCFRLWVLCPVALSMSASSGEPGLSLVWPHKGTAFLWGVKNFHLCIPWTKSSRTHFRGHWQHRQTLWPRFFGTHFTDSKTGMWWTGFQQLKCPVRARAIRERERENGRQPRKLEDETRRINTLPGKEREGSRLVSITQLNSRYR